LPRLAAAAHVSAFHGHPFSCAYLALILVEEEGWRDRGEGRVEEKGREEKERKKEKEREKKRKREKRERPQTSQAPSCCSFSTHYGIPCCPIFMCKL
jgi:hypothetical protein